LAGGDLHHKHGIADHFSGALLSFGASGIWKIILRDYYDRFILTAAFARHSFRLPNDADDPSTVIGNVV